MSRSALLLAAFAAVAVSLLLGVHALTEERIAANRRNVLLQRLEQVLPRGYDNDPVAEARPGPADPELGKAPPPVYPARQGRRVIGLALAVRAPDGYNGPIDLLVGVDRDGRIVAVRVVEHRETPGLGDGIEAERSNWIEQFRGRRLGDPPPTAWTVKRDGGAFDALTGATITPRAVIKTLRRTLEYVQRHRNELFEEDAR